MAIWVKLKDRQTGKLSSVLIDSTNSREAKQIAMEKYGLAYEIL
ncbi:hypothetical protein ACFFBA_001061 [Sneathia vaginalis]